MYFFNGCGLVTCNMQTNYQVQLYLVCLLIQSCFLINEIYIIYYIFVCRSISDSPYSQILLAPSGLWREERSHGG